MKTSIPRRHIEPLLAEIAQPAYPHGTKALATCTASPRARTTIAALIGEGRPPANTSH